MKSMLRIRDVNAGYGDSEVLHGIDLDVPDGQLLCVLGPSGGGKSTLLRIVAGLEPPTAGSIELAGRDLAGVPPHQRGVGLMFQDYALFPHRDVGQNVAFGLRMRNMPRDQASDRVSELLRLVGLPGAERRAVTQLSGGEQQRVALARALAPQPGLLMLDEPMGSLDRSLRERLPEELRAIFTELGLTVIYVTHDQGEALSVADRVVLLDDGRIVADGSPEELWTRPPSRWAATFLGFRNVAPARLTDGVLVTPWGDLPALTATVDAGASEGLLVLRPSALSVVLDGPITGTIVGSRFRGDHVLLEIDIPEAPRLYVEAREGTPPRVGERASFQADPGSAYLIDAEAALPSSS